MPTDSGHGDWFNWGTAQAFRNFAGHIALTAGADVFIPDYRLAPEHPFPAAVRDLEACYRGLVDQGTTRLALTGDSAEAIWRWCFYRLHQHETSAVTLLHLVLSRSRR